MTNFLKTYGDVEGPLGLPMKDKQARLLEQLLKAVPREDRQLVHLVTAKAPAELLPGERADVSWITTESVDRDGEIVIAKGMNDSQFAANPLVTMQHCYHAPPVGKSLWRKKTKDGPVAGIKAKTVYPSKPDDWPEGEEWPADCAWMLVSAGLLNGKSIGFLRLKSHAPSSHEIAAKPELARVSRIIDEWLLLEYACTFLPTNQDALVEAVSKGRGRLPKGWDKLLGVPPLPAGEWPDAEQTAPAANAQPVVPFTPWSAIEAAIKSRLAQAKVNIDVPTIVQAAYDRMRGRV